MESNQSQPSSGYPLWRNFAKTASLFTTVGVLLTLQTSCGGEEYETVAVVDTIKTTELTQGVITVVKEIAPNQYEIQEEKTVPNKADTRVIVKKMDGKIDTLTTEQVKAIVTSKDSLAARDTALHTVSQDTSKKSSTTRVYQSGYSPTTHTLGYVLMGGMMGYFIGKSLAMPPNPNVYRYPQQQYMNNQPYSSSGGGGSSYRYSGSSSNQNAYSSLRSTATTNTRTVTSYKSVPSGRSGFFGGRSSGSSSGRSSYSG